MYSIQNLTNRTIIFQGLSIPAYGSIKLMYVTDFVFLSKLFNQGKVSYKLVSEDKPVTVAEPVVKVEKKVEIKKEEVKPVKVEEPKFTEVIEKKDIEAPKAEDVVLEDKTDVASDEVIEKKEQPKKTYGKKNKKFDS